MGDPILLCLLLLVAHAAASVCLGIPSWWYTPPGRGR